MMLGPWWGVPSINCRSAIGRDIQTVTEPTIMESVTMSGIMFLQFLHAVVGHLSCAVAVLSH